MKRTQRVGGTVVTAAVGLILLWGIGGFSQEKPAASAEEQLQRTSDERQRFQSQELTTGKSGTWIFPPGETPRVVWRDPDEVRRLGCDRPLRVRWFDAALKEHAEPASPGRWIAWVEGTAPNGTPLRRGLTFFGTPKEFLGSYRPDLTVAFPHFPGPDAPAVLREHEAEFLQLASSSLLRAMLDSQEGAVLVAGLAESKPLGHPARYIDTASVLNDDRHLALKIKVYGLEDRVRPLDPPRRRKSPATVLHEGSLAEAGMKPDAKKRIDAVCKAWAEDTGEPFVVLVARRGVVVTHEAFGRGADGKPVGQDYRCWVASITKSVTGILFSQFLDQQRIALDDSLGSVFPDYEANDPHVPTFRQCFMHTTGLAGQGEFGGMRNPNLENIVLSGIDTNRPGVKYAYCGLGFELAAKAMELVAGRSAVRLYYEQLFGPLGFGDVEIGSASADGHFTAWELGVLAQWVANRGSYGPWEFITEKTFGQLLPVPIDVPEHGFWDEEGIGIHRMFHRKPGAPGDSKRPEDLLFSPETIGHGSFSGCIFLIDPEQQLIITQVRKQSGERNGEWAARFFQMVAEVVEDGKGHGDDKADGGSPTGSELPVEKPGDK